MAQPGMLTSGASGRIAALLSLRALGGLLILLRAAALLLLLPFRWRSAPASEVDGRTEATSSRKGGRVGVVVRVPAAMLPRRQREQEAAWRRALAIRRVMEARQEGRLERDFALLTTARDDTLFTQSWTPLNKETRINVVVIPSAKSITDGIPTEYSVGNLGYSYSDRAFSNVYGARTNDIDRLSCRGLVVLLHGLNEHRYDHFAKKLNDNGFKVYAMDWIGHGGSDGLHGYVRSLDYAVGDLKAFLQKVLAENNNSNNSRTTTTPCFCFGHSTGGAIVLKAMCDPKIQGWIKGIALTSPAVHVQPSHPIIKVLAPLFCLLAPKYQFSSANNSTSPVSRDPEAVKSKYTDPLVFTGSIRVRTGYEVLRLSAYLMQNLYRVNVPFLVLHGTSDDLTDPEGSRRLFDEASSTDKSIKLYPGLLHDLLIEPECDKIMADIIDWFSCRVS